YETLGSKIKCNPAIKDARHRPEIIKALCNDQIDVVATDHAPHTREEKAGSYLQAPSGLPLVQHSAQIMFELHLQGYFDVNLIAEKMSHAVARCFDIKERGFLKEGYYADAYLLDPKEVYQVKAENILFKCGWSPLEAQIFSSSISSTWVNGIQVWDGNALTQKLPGMRLLFDRNK
ncbi:MAG: dihydroorotase, partial [Limisphaerales bacterium]